jgi:predicted dehydrogenase
MVIIMQNNSHNVRPSRRAFLTRGLKATSGIAAAMAFGPHVAWGNEPRIRYQSANEKLNLAAIGVGNKGKHNVDQIQNHNWVAFCDVDENYLNECANPFPSAGKFRDYRKMFDQLANQIDAVVVSTADHTHAPATSIALSLDKHVYCEKPLTHTVAEARTIRRLASQRKVATQMGIQIHAESNYRRVVETIRAKAIGTVKEVYVWCSKGWSNGRFVEAADQQPASLDWDLWLGPAKERPFCQSVHPANWRRFWEFGSGTFGDMACHAMDLPFWALDLKSPSKVSATGSELHETGTPDWCQASYEFPMPDREPLKLFWSDGGSHFDLVKSIKDHQGNPLSNWGLGILFVGDEGMLAADYGRLQLLPADRFSTFTPPEQSIPNSIGHWNEWLESCKTLEPTTCNFEYAGRLTEAVLLGIVAYRSQHPIEWDPETMRISDNDAAQHLLTKNYRPGFEVIGLGRGD